MNSLQGVVTEGVFQDLKRRPAAAAVGRLQWCHLQRAHGGSRTRSSSSGQPTARDSNIFSTTRFTVGKERFYSFIQTMICNWLFTINILILSRPVGTRNKQPCWTPLDARTMILHHPALKRINNDGTYIQFSNSIYNEIHPLYSIYSSSATPVRLRQDIPTSFQLCDSS